MKTPFLASLDVETTGRAWEKHEVCQLACVMYDGQTMEPVPAAEGGVFDSLLRPLTPETIEDGALRVNGLTREQLAAAPHPKPVWQAFEKFVKGFHIGGLGGAPIMCGKNIRNFDVHFIAEMARKYGGGKSDKALFNRLEQIDLQDLIRQWFWHDPSVEKMAMDYLRDRFQMKKEGSHGALFDAQQTGYMITYFMKLTRELAKRRVVNGDPLLDFDAAFRGK